MKIKFVLLCSSLVFISTLKAQLLNTNINKDSILNTYTSLNDTTISDSIMIDTVSKLKLSPYAFNTVSGVTNFKNLFVYDFGINVTKSISKNKKINISLLYRTSAPILDQYWGSRAMVMNSDISSGILYIRYDYFPFLNIKKHTFFRSLKFTTGLQYLNNPIYSFKASLRDAVKWGQLTFTPDEVGWVNLVLKTNNFQPTIGFGYDNFFASKTFSIGIDAGGVYNGYPKVDMTAHNMLSQTVASAPRLEYNLRSYSIIPYAQLNFQYHFKSKKNGK